MLILLNKPYGFLSQFSDAEQRKSLSQLIDMPGVYPAGRLDRDSEGLLLLTDDGRLQQLISHPKHKWPKTYLVQVEGVPTASALARLEAGVVLKDGRTRPAAVNVLARKPGWLWSRTPPIRHRKTIPTHWLTLTITEGRNRQVRRMTAAVGLPTLRLIRQAVGPHRLGDLQPGQWRTEDTERRVPG